MKHRFALAFLTCTALLAQPLAANATVDYFLTFDGIKGDAVAEGHKGAIDVLSFAWGLNAAAPNAASGASGRGKASFNDLTWTQSLDGAVPSLLAIAASGKKIKTAVLDLVQGGEKGSTFSMKFSDVFINSVTISGSAGSDPVVQGSFNYGMLDLAVTPHSKNGSMGAPATGSWELAAAENDLLSAPSLVSEPIRLFDIAVPPVPETETWAMLLAGLGLVGLRLRRQRERAVQA